MEGTILIFLGVERHCGYDWREVRNVFPVLGFVFVLALLWLLLWLLRILVLLIVVTAVEIGIDFGLGEALFGRNNHFAFGIAVALLV